MIATYATFMLHQFRHFRKTAVVPEAAKSAAQNEIGVVSPTAPGTDQEWHGAAGRRRRHVFLAKKKCAAPKYRTSPRFSLPLDVGNACSEEYFLKVPVPEKAVNGRVGQS